MAVLQLRDVSKSYGQGSRRVDAVRDVSLDVDHGEVVALEGPSGSGKTTLLALAGALLSPTSGEIFLDGDNVTRYGARARTRYRRDRVGFVFQGSNMVPFLTARENLLVVGSFGGSDRSAIRHRADELLEQLDLGAVRDQIATRLSGGERQRVAIARALMRDPSLLLVDEPTASLNFELGTRVVDALLSEVHRRQKACIMVTHDDRMARLSDRIVEIRDGRILSERPLS
ncbi:MAG: hemin ABC transporter ATP-binding protein [Dehalococcoidia bacterium]|nr:hemin ABC transporter ATP-binding protein [Dehalococcoidia bacterium]|tara:strand:+ start:4418 stop:5104 length:687 start_codon:yes stop_codon:yes gene_type:complete